MAKVSVLVDVTVEIDPPSYLGYYDQERRARLMESWASELEDFIRDHRSQDPVSISVSRIVQDQCSHCHREWETFDDGEPCCCQKAQDEWKAAQETAADPTRPR